MEEEKIEAVVEDSTSPSSLSLSLSGSWHALNNLKLYSTAGDKVNQTAAALTETEKWR